MKHLLLSIACLFGFACSSQTMTPSQFTDQVVTMIRQSSPQTKVEVKAALELELTTKSGYQSKVYLDNAYKEYLQNPKAAKAVIDRYVKVYSEIKEEAATLDKTHIVPIIKDRQWPIEIAASLKARGHNTPFENVFDRYNDKLIIAYAEDRANNIRYLTSKDLEQSSIKHSDLRELAINNLKKILPKIEIHKGDVISMITAGGDYEACLLLIDELWKNGEIQVEGEIVVAIPTRDLLLVTGSKTPGGIAKLRELVQKSMDGPYRLTDSLFVYRNKTFVSL